MSNFTFLAHNFPEIYQEVAEAERFVYEAPSYAVLKCRTALEKTLFWLYENDDELVLPYDTKLSDLMYNDGFKIILPQSYFVELTLVRKLGNKGAHGTKVLSTEALQSLKYLFRFFNWLSHLYSKDNPPIPAFDESLIPDGNVQEKTRKQLEQLAEAAEQARIQATQLLKEQQNLATENEELKKKLAAHQQLIAERKEERKEAYKNGEFASDITSETETRKLLIDVLLAEAGWNNLRDGVDLEYKVSGMPLSTNPTGIGYVDYVLWDDNGLPLALIEAKRTLFDAQKGQHQATLYADCLEKQFGKRPLIFYSNGYETYFWEDQFYPPRLVSGFYTKSELQSLAVRGAARKDLRQYEVDRNIAGRPYQLQAIQRVAECFVTEMQGKLKGKRRKSLLVMATGSGKTRTAAALVDMMTKCNWAKRVLFLADRNALVTQAKNAFKEYLPQLSAIDLTQEADNEQNRLVFSTYPTIMNKIDKMDQTGERSYGIGHFDLIIIDEAHRSVYDKYQSIFDYFDSLLIGLTATPKKDIDHNTYELFEIEDDNPTFSYELDQAVKDNYLKPPRSFSVPLKFPREGVNYHELSDKDKRQFEDLFGIGSDDADDDGVLSISRSKINSFLFNADTVDKVLDYLMREGLHIEGGDKLGKTIIFAKKHNHAKFIEERFNKNYPEYSGHFLSVIDNKADKAQDLLERFCFDKGAEKDPQIAVSVDMMDTGVDAPRVLNLVFFKDVKSSSKYWQMIGRGTRLCPDIFGPGLDKEYFLIFDICGNFEFFNEFPEGYTGVKAKPLQQQLFELQLEIAFAIQNNTTASQEDQELAQNYIAQLHQKINVLDEQRFEVRKHWEYVKKYKVRTEWDLLTKGKIADIETHLSNLAAYNDDKDEMAKRLDIAIYQLQMAILKVHPSQSKMIGRLMQIGQQLAQKKNIPSVKQKETTIDAICSQDFWTNVRLEQLEKVRLEIRDLMQLLKDEKEKPVYSFFEDDLDVTKVEEHDLLNTYQSTASYKARVEQFIKQNSNFLVIDKLYRNVPITPQEVLMLEAFLKNGDFDVAKIKAEYETPTLGVFIRKILGMDILAANQHFATFIQQENLNANQMVFVQKIIDYLNKNGILDKRQLTQPPFTDFSDEGIFGIFEDMPQATKIIQLVDAANHNAEVG